MLDDITGEETGLAGEVDVAPKLGDPDAVREWALLDGKLLDGEALIIIFWSKEKTKVFITITTSGPIKMLLSRRPIWKFIKI